MSKISIDKNMANLTEETIGDEKLRKFLEPYGKLSEISAIKSRQGTKLAKPGYFLSLFSNSSVEDKKFIEICKKHNILVQFDIFSEF